MYTSTHSDTHTHNMHTRTYTHTQTQCDMNKRRLMSTYSAMQPRICASIPLYVHMYKYTQLAYIYIYTCMQHVAYPAHTHRGYMDTNAHTDTCVTKIVKWHATFLIHLMAVSGLRPTATRPLEWENQTPFRRRPCENCHSLKVSFLLLLPQQKPMRTCECSSSKSKAAVSGLNDFGPDSTLP